MASAESKMDKEENAFNFRDMRSQVPDTTQYSKEESGEKEREPLIDRKLDILVKDLPFNARKEIAFLLDPFAKGGKNWKGLAEAYEYRDISIAQIERNALGGGEASFLFLTKLIQRKPETTYADLIDKLKELDMAGAAEQITSFLVNYPNINKGNKIKKRPIELFRGVSMTIATGSTLLHKDWKDLASAFEFSYQDLRELEVQAGRQPIVSPTFALLESLSSFFHEFRVSELLSKLKDIGRQDVVDKLISFLCSMQQMNST